MLVRVTNIKQTQTKQTMKSGQSMNKYIEEDGSTHLKTLLNKTTGKVTVSIYTELHNDSVFWTCGQMYLSCFLMRLGIQRTQNAVTHLSPSANALTERPVHARFELISQTFTLFFNCHCESTDTRAVKKLQIYMCIQSCRLFIGGYEYEYDLHVCM